MATRVAIGVAGASALTYGISKFLKREQKLGILSVAHAAVAPATSLRPEAQDSVTDARYVCIVTCALLFFAGFFANKETRFVPLDSFETTC